MSKAHSFHIPVMGIGFTIDTPLKVSPLGINSVISLVDDVLLEKIRKVYSDNFNLPYSEISEKDEDFRAKRITSYLNLINDLVDKKIDEIKNVVSEKSNEFKEYFDHLPEISSLKQDFQDFQSKLPSFNELRNRFKDSMSKGSIDVNIMTKVDKTNYIKGQELPVEYNDAHAALRGFALSNLESSIILSAGMNNRLYAYMEKFEDFYPNKEGFLKKKIVLKVSDFKSAIIQGKYFAKRGLWVSEFRIESGLNCGGHAFATDGLLMGPILNEFKTRRSELIASMLDLWVKGLTEKNRIIPTQIPKFLVTYQGGVGTHEEHEFLMEEFDLDSIGWGTPFLLVSEVTNVDEPTRQRLAEALEDDLYLSGISPLGVPFNNLRGNTKDAEKQKLIDQGTPGSDCPRKFVKLNTELTSRAICTASRAFQNLKIKALDKLDLNPSKYQYHYDKIVEKSCICAGLGTSALIVHKADYEDIGPGVAVCPGPNMAYFSHKTSLKVMIDHIYGRTNVISRTDRPNVFVKELFLYINYLKNQLNDLINLDSEPPIKSMTSFAKNLKAGIAFYDHMFSDIKDSFVEAKSIIFNQLEEADQQIDELIIEIQSLSLAKISVEK
jgi:hypothetical protein